MRTLNGIRRALGTKGALHYLHDYHQARVQRDGTWAEAMACLGWYGPPEDRVVGHALYMNRCGSDFIAYRR